MGFLHVFFFIDGGSCSRSPKTADVLFGGQDGLANGLLACLHARRRFGFVSRSTFVFTKTRLAPSGCRHCCTKNYLCCAKIPSVQKISAHNSQLAYFLFCLGVRSQKKSWYLSKATKN